LIDDDDFKKYNSSVCGGVSKRVMILKLQLIKYFPFFFSLSSSFE
jgi:hypothetical protein